MTALKVNPYTRDSIAWKDIRLWQFDNRLLRIYDHLCLSFKWIMSHPYCCYTHKERSSNNSNTHWLYLILRSIVFVKWISSFYGCYLCQPRTLFPEQRFHFTHFATMAWSGLALWRIQWSKYASRGHKIIKISSFIYLIACVTWGCPWLRD